MQFGLDFGTTNSSLSILDDNNKVTLLPLDSDTATPEVIRSALYFHPRKLVISKTATERQIQEQEFNINQISYEGEVKTEIGAVAIRRYLDDNRFRKPGVLRKIYTGKTIHVILWTDTNSGKVYTADVPEIMEEIDYGTGRLLHALKTALKYPLYRGTTIFGQFYTLEELISLFVSQIISKTQAQTKHQIKEITVGRPVHFALDPDKDKAAQNRLEEAIISAGVENVKFEFEPIGAVRYFLSQKPSLRGKILVFDFGGGTLDTAIVEKRNSKLEVLTTGGVYIGGNLLNSDMFGYKLADYFGANVSWGKDNLEMPSRFIEVIKSWFGVSNLENTADMETLRQIKNQGNNPEAIDRLIYLIKANLGFEIYDAIEKAKKELTVNQEAFIVYQDGPINIDIKITRQEFEKLIQPRIAEVKETVVQTLRQANTEPGELTAVVATGGSSLLPIVKEMLAGIFGEEKVHYFELFTSIAAGLVL